MNPLPPEPPLWLYGVAVLAGLAMWLTLVVVIERSKQRNKTGRKDGQNPPGEKDMANTKIGATLHNGKEAAQGFAFEFPTEGAARNALAWLSRWAEGDTVPPLSPRVRRAFRDKMTPEARDVADAAFGAPLLADRFGAPLLADRFDRLEHRVNHLIAAVIGEAGAWPRQPLQKVVGMQEEQIISHEFRLDRVEDQLQAINAADERAARDAESPAEAEAAETESLAHQIDALRVMLIGDGKYVSGVRNTLCALSDRVGDLEASMRTHATDIHARMRIDAVDARVSAFGDLIDRLDLEARRRDESQCGRLAELEKWRGDMVETTKRALDELHEQVAKLRHHADTAADRIARLEVHAQSRV